MKRGTTTSALLWFFTVRYFLAICFALVPVVARAQTSLSPPAELKVPRPQIRLIESSIQLPIDLPTALVLASAHNLDILAAKTELAEAEARNDEALGRLLPQPYTTTLFFGQKTTGQTQGVFADLGSNSFHRINPAGGAELGLNPGQAVFDLLASYRTLDATAHDTAQVGQNVLAQVAIHYFRLEQAAAGVEIAEESLKASKELERVAETRESLGRGLKLDVMRAQARVANDQVRVSRAGQAVRDASVALALTLKLDPEITLFPLVETVRQRTFVDLSIALGGLISRALESRPALKAASEHVAAADNTRKAAWAHALVPSIYTNFQENNVSPSAGHQFYTGSIGLQFSVASLGGAWAADTEVDRARILQDKIRQEAEADVISSRDAVLTAQEEVESAFSAMHAARAALELSQTRFSNGVGIELDVLDSQAATVEAQTNLVAAIVGYNVAQVNLLLALGDVSPETLAR
jgi:outer membrane protein TolC